MGDRDIAEKALEWLPDIFADIVNAYFAIHGIKRVVQPDELMDTKERSVYVSSGDLRDQERDVVKLWTRAEAIICLMGFENQTDVLCQRFHQRQKFRRVGQWVREHLSLLAYPHLTQIVDDVLEVALEKLLLLLRQPPQLEHVHATVVDQWPQVVRHVQPFVERPIGRPSLVGQTTGLTRSRRESGVRLVV